MKEFKTKYYTVEERLPIPQNLYHPDGTYYLIETERFGKMWAMYLMDEHGHKDFYKDYSSKVVDKVLGWYTSFVEADDEPTVKGELLESELDSKQLKLDLLLTILNNVHDINSDFIIYQTDKLYNYLKS